jgi:hypothetical protein
MNRGVAFPIPDVAFDRRVLQPETARWQLLFTFTPSAYTGLRQSPLHQTTTQLARIQEKYTMNNAFRGLTLTFCLALTSAGLIFAQSASTEVAPAVTAAPVANVYVGTTKGVYLYEASTTGKLTLVSGSPFKAPAGLLIGVTGNYLITLGTHIVHSYQLSSTGAIEKQIASINTLDHYVGSNCDGYNEGTVGLSSLNHQGRNVYVVFPLIPGTSCFASIQTYNITRSGDLTFNGAIATGDDAGAGLFQAPAIIANDTFAYASSDFENTGVSFSGFIIGSNGEMQNWSFNMTEPVAPSGAGYAPLYVTADPTNHLAAMLSNSTFLPSDSVTFQLASYTVDGQGNLSTTSTAANMPSTKDVMRNDITTPILNMSPSGKLLAVGGLYGLQVFHFNGANPVTPYSAVLTTDRINRIHWDNNNHLFALSTKKLYVFTVTPTAITQVAGSPFTIPTGTPNALIVVPK